MFHKTLSWSPRKVSCALEDLGCVREGLNARMGSMQSRRNRNQLQAAWALARHACRVPREYEKLSGSIGFFGARHLIRCLVNRARYIHAQRQDLETMGLSKPSVGWIDN